LPDDERALLERVALECWSLFELRGYARVDIRMDDEGRPFVLEVNANPCLSRDAGFVAAASEAGIGYDRIIECVLEAAGNYDDSHLDLLAAAKVARRTCN
jgi:D-alanine-D-alanine ligase